MKRKMVKKSVTAEILPGPWEAHISDKIISPENEGSSWALFKSLEMIHQMALEEELFATAVHVAKAKETLKESIIQAYLTNNSEEPENA